MKKIILTLDYELYGNGSGNVYTHIIIPTRQILQIASKYHAKITIFFEYLEYLKLKEEWSKGNKMGYSENPAAAMEKQIREAYLDGHDIQLHIHPQWIKSKYINGNWWVDKSQWRLGGYQGIYPNDLENIIRKGKETLEKILQPIAPKYTCIALRAGGYNIMPCTDILNCMRKIGLYIDSSVYPGGYENGNLSYYDYSQVPTNLSYWYVDNDVRTAVSIPSNIIELPIVAYPIPRMLKYLNLTKIKASLQNKQSAKESLKSKTAGSKNIIDKINYFFQKEFQTWDYCLFSKQLHQKFLKKFAQSDRTVFTLIGHPKGFYNKQNFEYLLKQLYKKYSFFTIHDFYEYTKL